MPDTLVISRVPRRRAALHPEPRRAVGPGDRAARQHLRHRRHGDRGRRHRLRAVADRTTRLLVGDRSPSAAAIGAVLAARVEMTAMPELVAILHSFVGLAAVLVGISATLSPHDALTRRRAQHPRRRDLRRRLRRRGHVHRIDRRVRQAAGH